jgi:hypothetical protein
MVVPFRKNYGPCFTFPLFLFFAFDKLRQLMKKSSTTITHKTRNQNPCEERNNLTNKSKQNESLEWTSEMRLLRSYQ